MSEKCIGNYEMDGQSHRGRKYDEAQLEAARILYVNGFGGDPEFVAILAEIRTVKDLHGFIKTRTPLLIEGAPRKRRIRNQS